MWCIFAISALLQVVSSEFVCGGAFSEVPHDLSRHRNLITRSTTLSPIRIYFSFVNFDFGNAALNSEFNSTVLPATLAFFQRTLKVYPVIGNLVIVGGTCVNVTIPTAHATVGVQNADVIVYLSTNSFAVSYVAVTTTCQIQADGLNNPTCGSITFNIKNWSGLSAIGSKISVFTHEMTHFLGFSTGLFPYFKDSNGLSYTNGVTTTTPVRGVSKTIVTTPNVLSKARSIFGCSTLLGVELENYPSTTSHWDKRIMMNDFMTAYVPQEPIWSTVTLALLQDSGWYSVDYTLGQDPLFGRSSGCNYFNNPCVVSGVSADPKLWCTQTESDLCDFFALGKASCSVATYTSNLPSYFQYFSAANVGGTDAYNDFCPFRQIYGNGYCRGDYGTTTSILVNTKEVVGVTSRCFISTLDTNGYVVTPPYSACYPVISCTSTYAVVQIGTATLQCPFTGGVYSIPGFSGTITCPASDILCQDVPCVSMCYGQGTCQKGFCNCFSGYGGNDCSIKCSANCVSCNSSGCLSCVTGKTLSNGVCV